MKSPESHIKIGQLKNWAKYFPYSLYRAGWKSSILGWLFPIGITCDFGKHQFGLVRPTFILATFNMCLLTPQRNALLWSRLVLGWVQRNLNFGSLDRRLIDSKHCKPITGTYLIFLFSDKVLGRLFSWPYLMKGRLQFTRYNITAIFYKCPHSNVLG